MPIEYFIFYVKKGIMKNIDSLERLRLERKPRVLHWQHSGEGDRKRCLH